MARLKSLGFELNSATAGHEVDSFNGGSAPTISSTQKHSGSFAMRVNTAAATTSYIQNQCRATSTNKIYFRVWLYVVTLPAADGTIFGLIDHANTNQGCGMLLTTTGTLQLIGGSSIGFAHIGSASAALSLNTWYCVEISYDDSSSNAVTARLNGTQFTTATGEEMSGGSTDFSIGDIDGVGMQVYFDDIAYNDSTGSAQTSFPGQTSLLYLRPNVAGDANAFATQTGGTAGATNNYTRVNETPPNDATSFNGSSTLNQEDLFGMDNSGLGAGDTINVVEVHGRFRNSTADATAKITFEVEKTASGTKTSSSAITPNSTTFRSDVAGTTLPKTAAIVTYLDPDGAAWTNTTLDSMQAGYKLTTAPGTAGRRVDVTALWVIVDYTPASGSALTGPQADTITFSDAIVKALTLAKADTITFSDATVKTEGHPLADTITFSDAISKRPVKILGDTLTFSDVATNRPTLGKADTITFSDAATKALTKALADTTTFSDQAATTNVFQRAFADTTSFTDAISNAIAKGLADNLSFSDAIAQTIHDAMADTTTFSDAAAITTTKRLADTLTLTDSLTPTYTPGGGIDYSQPLADTLTLSDAIVKGFAKKLADTMTFSDASTRARAITLDLHDTIRFSDHVTFPDLVGVVVYPHIIVLLNGKLVLQLAANTYLPL